MKARAYKPVHGGRPRPTRVPADGSACAEGGCLFPVGHGGKWHDDGVACWPVESS